MTSAGSDELLESLRQGSDRTLARWSRQEEREKRRQDREEEEARQEPADSTRVKKALEDGGRAMVTVRSKKTGEHVSLKLAAKKRKPGSRRFLSRGSSEGRVGIKEADAIFVDDPSLMYPEGKVGVFYLDTGEWRPVRKGDPARIWSAEKVLLWALGSYNLEKYAEVFIELRCSFCGHALRDPVSIERGIGPECYGRHTRSKSAPRP